MVMLIVSGAILFYNSIKGNYVSVSGVCENIEVTGIRRRVKRITLKLEENSLTVSIKHRIKNSRREILLSCIFRKRRRYIHRIVALRYLII